MQLFVEVVKAMGGMPIFTLLAFVVLAAFALAGFAIYAVLKVVKELS